MKGLEQAQMTSSKQRVNYDLIAHLYDEPGRDHDTDPNLVEFLKEKTVPQFSRLQILDMGCGTGKQLAANHNKFADLQSFGLDLFHGMLLQANKRCPAINWVQGDSSNPPFADESFDYVTNQFSYHHVQNKIGMMEATHRILKPGGRFVITNLDPWSMARWIVYTYFPTSRQRDLSDFLPLNQLTSLMQKTGFCNIQVKHTHNRCEENLNEFLEYASQRYRISQLMAIQDDDYAAGMAELKRAVAKLGNDSRISSEICLVWVIGDKPE
jgi:ubiquinone/menaquinone biosynthesis C-methylase UbiE